jgi:uncharacterized membrane protein
MAAETRSMGESLEASRLVGFSDGVFAVVITLLVLNIQVPSEPISLHALMAQQCPSYLIFIVTFAMVGIKWLNHHRLFALIRRVDTLLSVLNLVLLLGICLVPFTAAMIAKYMTTPDAAFASVIYGIVWTINGFSLYGDSCVRPKERVCGIVARHAETGQPVCIWPSRLSGCDRPFVSEYLCRHIALSCDRFALHSAPAAATPLVP